MATLTGAVENGVYNKSQASIDAAGGSSTTSTSKTKESTGTSYDQEMFLSLLVAEMQYQDPLEPTSNTEYVSELASFTQIEAVQAVQEQMKTIEANSLVGNYVILIDDDNNYISGKVDYVVNDDGELKLSVNNGLYSIDQLDSVVDGNYYNGVLTAETFTDAVSKLPELSATTLGDKTDIDNARMMYDAMDDNAKKYVPADSLSKLESLEGRIKALTEGENGDKDE